MRNWVDKGTGSHNWCKLSIMIGFIASCCLVAGCQTVEDPRQDGFLSGISALVSGKYQERVEQKQAALDRERAINQDLDRQLNELSRQVVQVEGELNKAEQRLAALDQDIKVRRQWLRTERIKLDQARAESDRIKAKLNQARLTQARPSPARRPEESVDHTRNEIQEIQQDLKNLRNLVRTLAGK